MKVKLSEVIIITSIFIIEQLNHDLILNHLFTYSAKMQSINLNDDFLKMLIYFNNDIKRVSFSAVFTHHL